MTVCPGVVVVQECEEEGVDAAGGAYCARFSQQIALQAGETTTPVRIGEHAVHLKCPDLIKIQINTETSSRTLFKVWFQNAALFVPLMLTFLRFIAIAFLQYNHPSL